MQSSRESKRWRRITASLGEVSNVECVKGGPCKDYCLRGFPGGAVVENLPANAGDTGSSPGLGRSHMPRSN